MLGAAKLPGLHLVKECIWPGGSYDAITGLFNHSSI